MLWRQGGNYILTEGKRRVTVTLVSIRWNNEYASSNTLSNILQMQSRGTVTVLKLQEVKQIWLPRKQCSQFYTYHEIAMDLGVRIKKQRES